MTVNNVVWVTFAQAYDSDLITIVVCIVLKWMNVTQLILYEQISRFNYAIVEKKLSNSKIETNI